MKKELRSKQVKSKRRGREREKRRCAFGIIFSMTILSLFITGFIGQPAQATEIHGRDDWNGGDEIIFDRPEEICTEDCDEKDGINFSRKKEPGINEEELLVTEPKLLDALEAESAEPQDLPEPEANYNPVDTYPWGKGMTYQAIVLVAPDSEASEYRWQTADSETGEFTDIDGANGREYPFTPINGKWYRVVMDNSVSRAVQTFQTFGESQVITGTGAANLDGTKALKIYRQNQWYITNGFVAYTVVSIGDSDYQKFDVLGRYEKNGIVYWMNTAYSNGWQLLTSISPDPSAVGGTVGNANLKELRFQFEEEDKTALHIEAVMGKGVHAFCFGSDVMLGTSEITRDGFNPDCAALTMAQRENGTKVVQMVGAQKPFQKEDPAVVLNYTGMDPDRIWLGFYSERKAWTNNETQAESGNIKTDGEKVIEYSNADSGMTSSWMNLSEGASVRFSFNIGNVSENNVVKTAIVQVKADPAEGGTVTGSGSYVENESVTVTAEAKEGYEFVRWTEERREVSREACYNFTALTDRNLSAEFREIVYKVQVSASPAEGGTVTGGGNYRENTVAEVKAAAEEGYEFVRWTEEGEEVSTEADYRFTVTASRNLAAEFEETEPEPEIYAVQVKAEPSEGGGVTGGGSYTEKAVVEVKAEAKEGYRFVRWTEQGEEVSTEEIYQFTITANRNLIAEFEETEPEPEIYTVQVNAEPSEGGSVTGGGSYIEKTVVEVKAEAESGYEFVKWTEQGEEVGTEEIYQFTITANRNLTAEFKETEPKPDLKPEPDPKPEPNPEPKPEPEPEPDPKIYTVQVSAEPLEGGSVTGGGSYRENTIVEVKAEAKEGYVFTKWMENKEEVSREAVHRFWAAADRSLTACFSPVAAQKTEYTITFDGNGGEINMSNARTVNRRLAELPTAVRRGYVLKGWYTSAAGGMEVTLDTEFDSDAIVYAQWKKEESSTGESGFQNKKRVGGQQEEGRLQNQNSRPADDGSPGSSGNELDEVPRTGDTSDLGFWILAEFFSGLGALYLWVKNKRIEEET